ncbi:MAG: VCBS repeat-containing protein [Myxococcota bacterium]
MPSLLLALLACKSTPTPPVADGPAFVVSAVPDPLAPCGDGTIEIELANPLDPVDSIDWTLGPTFGSSPLVGTGTSRSFDLPQEALDDSCGLPTCQLDLEISLTVGVATFTTEVPVVVLTDVDPVFRFDGERPEDLPSAVLYVTDEGVEASLELSATDPDRLVVSAAACIEGGLDEDCIRVPMTYDGGGDWVAEASDLVSCRAGQLKDDWRLQVEVAVAQCATPLTVFPVDLRFLEEDCDADGLIARSDTDGDCDDLDPDDAVSLGELQFPDEDEDGYGAEGSPGTFHCPQDPPPSGPVSTTNDDCDDTDPDFRPLVLDDECDGIDQNCNGNLDEDAQTLFIYPDDDGDGWGFNDGFFQTTATICELPIDGWGPQSDCDEDGPNATAIHPGLDEDPATPFDDNCDLSHACAADCDTTTELIVATATGLVSVEDPRGIPTFDMVRTWSETPVGMGLLDIDGNGMLDALLSFSGSTVLERDLASPTGTSETLASVGGGTVEVGDFDLDGLQDAFVGSDGMATVYWGGVGTPASTDLDLGETVGRADFDQDGCDDLVLLDREDAGSYDTVSHVFFGTPDGNGACERTFTDLPLLSSGPRAFAVGDLDGTGGPELAIAMEQSGTTSAPVPTMESVVVELAGRTPTEQLVPVQAATAVAISRDARLAFGHADNGIGDGISTWERGTAGYAMLDELEGTQTTALLWYTFDNPGSAEDLLALTDRPMGFDRLFFDGDPALREFMAFDIPSSGARVIPLPEGFGYREILWVGRHPDGSGNDHTRYYTFGQQTTPNEFLLTVESAFAPYGAFPPSWFPPVFPPVDLP